MRLSKLVPGACVALAFAVAGCGDSTGGGSSTITVTQSEAAEMWTEVNEALSSANFSAARAGGPSLSRMSLPELNKAVSISATANCGGGGTVGVSGTSDATATGGNFDLTLAFSACKTTHFTLGGNLNYKGNETVSQSSFTVSYTVTGSITVSATDGRSGTCGFDFTVDVNGSLSGSGATVSVSGTFCGVQASAVINSSNA